ncbi:integrin alpha-PS1 isoform X1 [Neodiprion fabricii]|uniref:integrin alpha-PS1 isoform X1 n=1 Tax=Neodiprion fabricii TaxID=2872261 RepID=UPI001ED8C42E|nr:integrin alpha-PS1 isoform X1 [Neodiprion fabricii]XP_046412842.1 integrin alpha-PS1 isoform X1 [Neodiprion fabricii]
MQKYFISTLLILSISRDVFGFNLEYRIPVIKRGSAGSYFGYSVAEHQDVSDDDSQKSTSWMLVGAPLDQNRQPGTNRSGALWKCPLTTNTLDCEQVVTDGRTAAGIRSTSIADSEDLVAPNNESEIKDNQWLGVTVRSQGVGGKVMVCAHRYIVKTPDSRWGQGLCYILTKELEFEDVKKPCSGRRTNKAHEEFGYCQAGTSGLLTSEDRVLIGTPGPHTWRGNLFVFSIADNFLDRDNTIYHAPMQDASPVNKYSYLGMSVAAGNFFSLNTSYATGAPRSNGTGQVVLLSRHHNQEEMSVDLILDGEQFASSYGYEITSADVNGDNLTDLVVAAPFYFNKAEGGAVYVYTMLCKNATKNEKCNKPIKLIGREESRFGFALTNLGDLNKDGYEDIAIGAPYEGRGAVYIYLGSKDGLITSPSQVIHSSQMPTSLSTFGYSLSGGIDMDKNGYPDLLVGAYDDNAVILLRSRKIIDITTYIRYQNKDLTYQEKIAPIDPNKHGCPADPTSNYTCFSFEACCKTASLVRDEDTQNLRLNYYIEAETYSGVRKFSRVWFKNDNLRPSSINRTVTLDPKGVVHCQSDTVYLKENTRDIQSPIKFRFNYTLIQEEPVMPVEGAPLPEMKNFPILNQQEAARIFEATFQKECGSNDICESNVQLQAALNLTALSTAPNFYELLLGEKEEVVVDVNVTNIGESAYEAQLFIIHSPSLSYIASKSNDSILCNLYNNTVVCAIGNPFKMNQSVNIQVRFDPKGLGDNESQLEFITFVNSTSKEVIEKKPISLKATVSKRAELSIQGNIQRTYYGGLVIGESAIKHLHEVGPKVSHVYEVFNEGPWKVNIVEVHISWPYEVANDKPHGKWLLYLEELPTVQASGGGQCSLPYEHDVNPLGLQGSLSLDDVDAIFPSTTVISPLNGYMNRSSNMRRRRDTEKVINTKTMIGEDGLRHQIVSMNCKASTAKCFDIKCIIYNLQRNQEAVIAIKARLWNSTLVEDYPRVDEVRIGSNARIIIPSNVVIEQENLKDDEAVAETIAYPSLLGQQDAEPVPIWIIIVAIVAGLLLLILLTLVLWKLGFFKRRRPDPTLSGNLEKHRDDNPENEALFKH